MALLIWMLAMKSFRTAAITLAGVELAHRIRKREFTVGSRLWVTEGMGLIDSNQHTRLRSCFEMRCHCAHPGEAPITEYNLMSMFSDIQQIVLENPKFAL
jgi:hypothetical protein